jgi:hypothetical protein
VPVALLAAAGPAWMMFVSTSAELYLRNQVGLNYQLRLLAPFAALASILALAGAWLLRKPRSPAASALGWLYVTGGAVLLGVAQCRDTVLWFVQEAWGLGLVVVVWVGACTWLARRRSPSRDLTLLAVFAAAWIAGDVANFLRRRIPEPPTEALHVAPSTSTSPNIYHLVLDEYDTRLFLHTLDASLSGDLSGFEFYENAVSVEAFTIRAMPAILTGRRVDVTDDVEALRLMDTDASLVAWLRRGGYGTYTYAPELWTIGYRHFSVVRTHGRSGAVPWSPDHHLLFRSAWAHGYVPEALHGWIPRHEGLIVQLGERVLPNSQAAASVLGARMSVTEESQRPARGQYVLVHLLLPHPPFVMSADCAAHRPALDPVEQARCTNLLMTEFLRELKRLGRFESSLIVIQGDHGGEYRFEGGQPVKESGTRRSLQSLLLVKRSGVGDAEPLRRITRPVSLLDVAPTILTAAGVAHPLRLQGQPLQAP